MFMLSLLISKDRKDHIWFYTVQAWTHKVVRSSSLKEGFCKALSTSKRSKGKRRKLSGVLSVPSHQTHPILSASLPSMLHCFYPVPSNPISPLSHSPSHPSSHLILPSLSHRLPFQSPILSHPLPSHPTLSFSSSPFHPFPSLSDYSSFPIHSLPYHLTPGALVPV